MLNRWVEHGLLDVLDEVGAGLIAFTPLAQGLLTNKYLNGVPEGSRAAGKDATLSTGWLDDSRLSHAARARPARRHAAVRPWPRWRCRGCCGIHG